MPSNFCEGVSFDICMAYYWSDFEEKRFCLSLETGTDSLLFILCVFILKLCGCKKVEYYTSLIDSFANS